MEEGEDTGSPGRVRKTGQSKNSLIHTGSLTLRLIPIFKETKQANKETKSDDIILALKNKIHVLKKLNVTHFMVTGSL